MKAKDITLIALLASIMYVIYTIGSGFLYFELLNFTVLLYGVTFSKKTSYFSTLVFSLLVILTWGLAPWTVMYLVVFPVYSLIYSSLGNHIRSEYLFAAFGFILAFFCGTIIDLPYIYMAGLDYRGLVIRLLLGFQVSIINAGTTFISTLFLLYPIRKALLKSTNNQVGHLHPSVFNLD